MYFIPDCSNICHYLKRFSICDLQGLPGIDGKDGTPGIPGLKVGTYVIFILLFMSQLNLAFMYSFLF